MPKILQCVFLSKKLLILNAVPHLPLDEKHLKPKNLIAPLIYLNKQNLLVVACPSRIRFFMPWLLPFLPSCKLADAENWVLLSSRMKPFHNSLSHISLPSLLPYCFHLHHRQHGGLLPSPSFFTPGSASFASLKKEILSLLWQRGCSR